MIEELLTLLDDDVLQYLHTTSEDTLSFKVPKALFSPNNLNILVSKEQHSMYHVAFGEVHPDVTNYVEAGLLNDYLRTQINLYIYHHRYYRKENK